MKFFDFDHPFFRPLWRRIATVGVAVSWGIFEFLMGNHFWGALFVGIGALSFYGLFVTFNPRDPEPKD